MIESLKSLAFLIRLPWIFNQLGWGSVKLDQAFLAARISKTIPEILAWLLCDMSLDRWEVNRNFMWYNPKVASRIIYSFVRTETSEAAQRFQNYDWMWEEKSVRLNSVAAWKNCGVCYPVLMRTTQKVKECKYQWVLGWVWVSAGSV